LDNPVRRNSFFGGMREKAAENSKSPIDRRAMRQLVRQGRQSHGRKNPVRKQGRRDAEGGEGPADGFSPVGTIF